MRPEDRSVAIARSRWWDEGGVRVCLAWPEQPPPPGGYPMLCVLDGHALFGTTVEAARLQAGRPGVTGVQPGVILGLGYPGDRAAQITARRRDYTPPPLDAAQETGEKTTGGGDAFLRLIETSILPRVAQSLPIDRGRLALFGHSFGGLLPLHALFSGSLLFRCGIAASPSLWWADHAMLRQAQSFTASAGMTRLLLTVGGLERPDPAACDPDHLERQRRTRMAESVHELAASLSRSLAVSCVEFPGENHGSVLPAAIGRAIPFALRAGP